VYDWGRPQTDARPLHIEKSIKVTQADLETPIIPMPPCKDGTHERLIQSEYFILELLCASTKSIHLDTKGESFHTITLIEGRATLRTANESLELDTFQTAVIPAYTGNYQFEPASNCRALKSSLQLVDSNDR
jgi:mannose-6-phosphate isomerase